MNIALLSVGTLSNPKESARITLLLHANSLIEEGHTVTIFARKARDFPIEEKIGEVILHRIASLYRYPQTLRTFQRESGTPFDIIHGFSATPLLALLTKLAKINPKTKIIHTLKSYSKYKWQDYFHFALNLADRVTVPTTVFSDKLRLVNKNKIQIVHSPINTEKFYPQNKPMLKKKYGFNNDKVLFYYGALWKNKGVDDLIDSLPFLIKEYKNIKLLIAPRYTKYQLLSPQLKRIQFLNLEPWVKFILEDIFIEEYVNLADVVVLPYRNLIGTEGNPSCLLEAMACKTPVVTTTLPELQEVAEGSVFMATPSNVNSLAKNIRTALIHPSLEMVERAYHKSKEFKVENITKEFLKMYNAP